MNWPVCKSGNFLENDFWTPPPLLSILYMTILFFIFNKLVYIFRIIGHVAAALGPLACASRSARLRHVGAALGPLACPNYMRKNPP